MRQVKQLRRLHAIKETDIDRIQRSFRERHSRSPVNSKNKKG